MKVVNATPGGSSIVSECSSVDIIDGSGISKKQKDDDAGGATEEKAAKNAEQDNENKEVQVEVFEREKKLGFSGQKGTTSCDCVCFMSTLLSISMMKGSLSQKKAF